MLKRIGAILIIFIFLFCSIGIVMAGGKKGNARKGKYLFRKNCRSCHIEGGSAKEISPISKTQAQWQKVFDNQTKLKCKDECRNDPRKTLPIYMLIFMGMLLIHRHQPNANKREPL